MTAQQRLVASLSLGLQVNKRSKPLGGPSFDGGFSQCRIDPTPAGLIRLCNADESIGIYLAVEGPGAFLSVRTAVASAVSLFASFNETHLSP